MALKTFGIHEAAAICGISPQTVRKYCDEKIIFSTRNLRGYRRIPIQEVERLQKIVDGAIPIKEFERLQKIV